VTYRFDDGIVKLIGKYSDGNKTGFVETAIAYYIKDIIEESDTSQQDSGCTDAIQTGSQSSTHQLNIRIDELKGSIEKMENKHQEEIMYWRDKIDNWEQRYDLQVLESNKKFDRLMKSIDESRHSYLQNTGQQKEKQEIEIQPDNATR